MNIDAVHEEELKACNVVDIKEGVTSDNVAKLLGVSNITARRYLNELESENKIKQHGERGRNVFYTLV
ncbi:MAG: FaeA/PapI family transcriptional regulator [Candidatus Pacebacteria bacterium]|jgi:DeoR/GlpR family transcriptional regulator of sugar metabolism|nr:FaeA/PapI family transcriptional regulator [Candidatus Paceibacterota bacterium]MDP7159265.1 FaeA/PapI family transcriptional regulator [Candidatus Paceibacterota bacterium]MDP7466067.1 FaeA/PapI family transcriptional regulator [Candidatus Paceibacterota bacterium]|tara:strand:- start:18571 stop:18774 length:204 start_codon:yes stop_codon:yes gene_type:complete